MNIANKSKLMGVAVLSLGLVTAGCGGVATNASLYSTKQPVVERTNFTLDVDTNRAGLSIAEKQRLNGWFETMDLRYGDRITIEDPGSNPAVSTAVDELARRYGLVVSEVAPTTPGALAPGSARIVITRSSATVPGCPDWTAHSDTNYGNATSPGYGCAVNSNLAAMVANPEDLIEGQTGSGENVVASGSRAIQTYREAEPSGAGGLQDANVGGN